MSDQQSAEISVEYQEMYLQTVRETGLHYHALADIGVTHVQFIDYCVSNPIFKQKADDAMQYHCDSLLKEAIRRAVEGDKVDVWGGKFRDERVGSQIVKSDKLLELLVKYGHVKRDEIGKVINADAIAQNNLQQQGVMVVPGKHKTDNDWEKQHGAVAAGKHLPSEAKSNLH